MVATPKFAKGRNFNDVAYELSFVEAQRLEKYFEVKLGENPYLPGLTALMSAFPGPGMVWNPTTSQLEKKIVKYQAFPALKAQMPEILERTLALMRAETSRASFAAAEGVSVEIPKRLFDQAAFQGFAGLFDPRYNPNADAALSASLLAALKTELNPVYAAWGIPDAAPLSTAELRRLFREKSGAAAPELKAFVEAELARIGTLEASFAQL